MYMLLSYRMCLVGAVVVAGFVIFVPATTDVSSCESGSIPSKRGGDVALKQILHGINGTLQRSMALITKLEGKDLPP